MATADDKNTKAPATTDADGEDDVEGHNMLMHPSTSREFARAREADIQRSLRARQLENEAKRPYKK